MAETQVYLRQHSQSGCSLGWNLTGSTPLRASPHYKLASQLARASHAWRRHAGPRAALVLALCGLPCPRMLPESTGRCVRESSTRLEQWRW